MTALDQFVTRAQEVMPSIQIAVDRPADSCGDHWLDVIIDTFETTVLWRVDQGFGFFTHETAYGDKPDELYKKADTAVTRLQQFCELARDPSTRPTPGLKEFRNLVAMAQTTLADKLNIQQSAISRMEGREDIKLSSFLSYMEGLGIQLEIKAHHEDFEMSVPITLKKHSA